ncbi:helix-turn-helix domain-containing protein [Cellulomonas endophytica]|uniref:helix-turn-helix domain-containing protein n=1 Tax=Cellulomonas endophytica TaxID=2494735 RepID=UPI001010105C|nr:helix-turn-helix domain-containing protein [Cellulomonas endophytica]
MAHHDATRDLSLTEAARVYDVPVTTLRRRVGRGEIPAYKVRGVRGYEWRLSRRALDERAAADARTPRGPSASTASAPDPGDDRPAGCHRVLEQELVALRRAAAAERHRADRADRELGHALLESGRMRSALEQAGRAAERCPDCPVPVTLLAGTP